MSAANERFNISGIMTRELTCCHVNPIIPFPETQQNLVESLASLAAAVLTKRRLIDAQRQLFESFIKLIGRAIDHKSPVTGKHCEQVPEIAMLMADAINNATKGTFADTHFSDNELYELRIASWLHDCGKITTPEYIIDKATKLHTMFDRIDLIESRFREYKLHLELELLKKRDDLSENDFFIRTNSTATTVTATGRRSGIYS